MESQEVFALMFTLSIFSGVFIIFLGMRQRAQQLEMQHRERMAMIERGQVPPPESLSHAGPGSQYARAGGGPGAKGLRSMSLGIVIIAVGLGLMSIISIAADSPAIGIGIGGAIVIVGLAFVVVATVTRNLATQDAVQFSPPPRIPRDADRID